VLVPLTPGVHSALGLLMSDVKHDYVRSKLVGLDDLDLTEINHMFHQLIERANDDLQSEGFTDEEIKIEPYLDLRYAGQGYELTVPCSMPPDQAALMRCAALRHHASRTRPQSRDEPVELVSLRLFRFRYASEVSPAGQYRVELPSRRAQGFLKEHGAHHANLQPHFHQPSPPAIVEQLDTTTVIQPEQKRRGWYRIFSRRNEPS
jgi:N-methylhydantoinase A